MKKNALKHMGPTAGGIDCGFRRIERRYVLDLLVLAS